VELWVVVPAYNEAAGIAATLTALAAQEIAPAGVLVVDNASTDGTGTVVKEFAVAHPLFEVVEEPEKGTGSAADTGFRAAIARGATHLARTDADCVPPPGWLTAITAAFGDGLEFVAGGIKARTDEFPLRRRERLLPLGQELAALFGRLRPSNRGPQFHGPYVMAPACSLAITAELYERSGGFPRAPIEEIHDDRELVNRVRRLTGAYGRRRDVWVYWSMRRTRAYGVFGTLRWYRDHGNRPKVVDIRL
jgi:glycosyltransferase involved in cell wall biosynthesis